MGRIVDLCGEVAAAADEGPEGLVLPLEAWDRLRDDWSDEDIEDALGLVKDSLLQSELVEAADSLSARLVELLGTWGEAKAWAAAVEGHAAIPLAAIRQLAHRLDRLEEVLELFRDQAGPDRRGFDELQRRLMDLGIESRHAARLGAAGRRRAARRRGLLALRPRERCYTAPHEKGPRSPHRGCSPPPPSRARASSS